MKLTAISLAVAATLGLALATMPIADADARAPGVAAKFKAPTKVTVRINGRQRKMTLRNFRRRYPAGYAVYDRTRRTATRSYKASGAGGPVPLKCYLYWNSAGCAGDGWKCSAYWGVSEGEGYANVHCFKSKEKSSAKLPQKGRRGLVTR